MYIVDFSEKTFQEIPIQDNPAFIPKKDFIKQGHFDGCLLIVKQNEDIPAYKNRGKFVVLRVTPIEDPMEEDSINHVGLFWEHHYALNFAKLLTGEIFEKQK